MVFLSTVTIQHPQGLTKTVSTQPGSGADIGIEMPSHVTDNKSGDETETELPIPSTVAAAREILKKFQEASTPADKAINDSVSGEALQNNTTLQSETWAGTEDEKKDW
jgi:hypothetical protein